MRRFAIPDIHGHSLYMLKLSHLVFQCLLRDTEIFHSFSGFFQQRSFEGPQGPHFAYQNFRSLPNFKSLLVPFGGWDRQSFWSDVSSQAIGCDTLKPQASLKHRIEVRLWPGVEGSLFPMKFSDVSQIPFHFLMYFFWLLTLKQQIAY